jgi:outer membrane immunogenic protein
MEDSHDGGPAFGFEAGADANIGQSILVGAYAGVDFSDIDKCDELFGDDELCVEGKHNFALGLRGGLRIGDGGVIYVKGGLSRTKLKASYTDDTDTLLFSGSEKTKGWHIGAGVEVAVSGGLYVKGEYVHTRYRNVLEDQLADTDSIDPSRHQIMAGIGFKFGGTSGK